MVLFRGYLLVSLLGDDAESSHDQLVRKVAAQVQHDAISVNDVLLIDDVFLVENILEARDHFSDLAEALGTALFCGADGEVVAPKLIAKRIEDCDTAVDAARLSQTVAEKLSFDRLDHSIPGFWSEMTLDVGSVDTGESPRHAALWQRENPNQMIWDRVLSHWSRPGSPYAFWRRWYESLLAPASHPPIPAPVLHQIALIDEDTWKQGAEVVAEEIARIEAQYALLQDVRALRAEFASLKSGVASPEKRADNYPPGVEPLEVLPAEAATVEAELARAETELEKPHPSRAVLRKAAAIIGKAAKAVLVWAARKADKVVDTGLEEGTKQVVRWGAGLVSLGVIDRLLHLSEAIGRFVQSFPGP
ncbi:hypothetical protein SAMN05661107_2869 [Maritimibacter sp. HL-12]|nr:hypothetical protein SAMN05661107_2869 [Maritimibacter sp. HL-12]